MPPLLFPLLSLPSHCFFHLSLSAQKSTSSLLQWNDRSNRQTHLLIFCSASTNEGNWKCESGTLHLPHMQQPLLLPSPNPTEMHWKNCLTHCRWFFSMAQARIFAAYPARQRIPSDRPRKSSPQKTITTSSFYPGFSLIVPKMIR